MEPWLKVMLCDTADVVPEGDEWVLERKQDGWRAIFHRDADGVKLYGGRNASDYTGKLPYLEAMFHRLPEGTAIDGELIGSHGDNSVVQSVMFSNGEHDIATSPIDPLRFVAFDITLCAGQDVRALPWEKRRELLEQAGFKGPLVLTSEVLESTKRIYEALLDQGAEGAVCKRTNSKYAVGRSASWVKVKPTLTVDAEVIGFEKGTVNSEFDGTLGALKVRILDQQPGAAVSGVEAKVGTGFDRATRDKIWATRQQDVGSWLGKIIEIRCQSIGASGKPRFPRFERVRDDLMPAGTTTAGQPIGNKPKPKAPRTPRAASSSSGAKPRNYGAMGDAKLVNCLRDFDAGRGPAIDEAVAKGRDLANEEALCRAAAKAKGLA